MTLGREVNLNTSVGNTTFTALIRSGTLMRDLLSPDLVHLIQRGGHRLLDARRVVLNIDGQVPTKGTGPLEFYIEPREVQAPLWINQYPLLETRVLLVLGGDPANQEPFARMIEFLHRQGIPAVGFRTPQRLWRFCQTDLAENQMQAGGLLCDRAGLQSIHKDVPGLRKVLGVRLLPGYAFDGITAKKSVERKNLLKWLPWTVQVPAADRTVEIEVACRRAVVALGYDIRCLLQTNAAERKDLEDSIRRKIRLWLPRVMDLNAADLDAGVTELLCRCQAVPLDAGVTGAHHMAAMIGQVEKLHDFCMAIGESIDSQGVAEAVPKAGQVLVAEIRRLAA